MATLGPGQDPANAPEACIACHGADGIAQIEDAPNLAGETVMYIDTQLKAFRSGKRKHPILGYTRLHAGVDFAAPTGTPIYAAGDGTVEVAHTNGGYGKYIRIRHNGTYSTAYAHLNGYARGVRQGKRVRQGQVIGYVGSTGRSTGPHLHYEIHRHGKQINPLGLKLPSGEKLGGERLTAFQALRESVYAHFAELAPAPLVAEGGKTLAD